MKRITIIGDGGWGTALGLLLHQNGRKVRIWGPFPDYIERLRSARENTFYLPGIQLPEAIQWTADPKEAVAEAELVILAVPSKYCREVFKTFSGKLPAACKVLSVTKGLDPQSHRRISILASEILHCHPMAVLSGPSHAEEVARGIPTAVVVTCEDEHLAKTIQKVFMCPRFRVYTSNDIIGAELGGALKNIIAIAVGISDGIGFGDNTRAALITRGLAEITRLGHALGAHTATFSGLSGLGDLVVTCTSKLSRNRAVGERLGKGEPIGQITASMKQISEGITTCAIARTLAHEKQVRTPIIEEVHAVIHNGKDPQEAVQSLMTRDARAERE